MDDKDCDCADELEQRSVERGWGELNPKERWISRQLTKHGGEIMGLLTRVLSKVERIERTVYGTDEHPETGIVHIQRLAYEKISWTKKLFALIAAIITFLLGTAVGALALWEKLH